MYKNIYWKCKLWENYKIDNKELDACGVKHSFKSY